MEVRTLEVGHGIKVLLPYGVLLILSWKKRNKQCCCIGEVVLTQGGEGDMRHHLNVSVGLVANDGPDHGSVGSKGIDTLTSHLSKPWAMDSRLWQIGPSPS
jgi:hypothetical protein